MADEAKKSTTKARVLVDHGNHKVDDIIEGAAAEQAVLHGQADDHPSAVAYAQKVARRKARDKAGADD